MGKVTSLSAHLLLATLAVAVPTAGAVAAGVGRAATGLEARASVDKVWYRCGAGWCGGPAYRWRPGYYAWGPGYYRWGPRYYGWRGAYHGCRTVCGPYRCARVCV
ncbi:MAG: hypothetical protein NW223_21525 [Hyphomicrobiaceae bacterium]|nr:hypothetical protein [Hyphomicrobiaceae bacterium]